MDDGLSNTPVCSGRLRRTFFVVAGSVFLATGVVGIVVPVLPTTPFLILAAFCYGRAARDAATGG
jgi:uncharacterized membrane protein YbaN (DUF454 family)